MNNYINPVVPEINFDEVGNPIIEPMPSSSEKDFDFYVGKWRIRNRKLKNRLQNSSEWFEFDAELEMSTMLNGRGNIDHFYTEVEGQSFEGMTLRIFNPTTKLWKIYWCDTTKDELEKPVAGSFSDDIGHFFTSDKFEGRDILVVFCWDARDKKNPVWSQAFSIDKGKTWEWNWYMFFSKIE